jgi:hypothetical protein
MAGKRTARIAFGLIIDLADRLVAAGVSPEAMPDLDTAIRMTWPLARRLAKLEKHGQAASRTAVRAREALLWSAVAGYSAAPWLAWPEFKPAEWHTVLVPGPAPDRAREAA